MPPYLTTSFGSALGFGAATAGIGMGLGIVGQGVSGLIDNAFYKRNLNLQVNAQKSLIDYQNEYNDPSHQMQRLMAAGLNPNLVYGSAAPAGVSGNASAPSGSGFGGHFNTQDVAAAAMHFMQMKELDSQMNLNNATANERNANAALINKQAGRYDQLIDVEINEANARIEELSTRKDLNISNAAKADAEKALAEADTAYKNGLINQLEYQKQQIIAETILLGAQAKKAKAEEQYYIDSAGLVRQKKATEVETTRYTQNLANKEAAEAEIQQIQAEWDRIVKRSNSNAARQAMYAELMEKAHQSGIEGKKAVIWTNRILDWLEKGSRVAKNLGNLVGGE